MCTSVGDAYGEEWCATQTDQDNSVIEWGHCSPGCEDRFGGLSDSAEGQTNININKMKF